MRSMIRRCCPCLSICRDPAPVALPTLLDLSLLSFFLPANKATPNGPLSRNHALSARHVGLHQPAEDAKATGEGFQGPCIALQAKVG